MFSTLRNRFGIPGVISTIALVLTMTGGAFAAKYLITSPNQIKPSVLKKLKGAKGAPGADGAPGAQGSAGPAGANGKDGAPGEKGAKGEPGADGTDGADGNTVLSGAAPPDDEFDGADGDFYIDTNANQIYGPKTGGTWGAPTDLKGTDGSPWVVGEAPSGAVLKGTWSIPYYNATGAGELAFTSISTGVPVPDVPFQIVRDPSFSYGDPEVDELVELLCPGTAENPTVDNDLNPVAPGATTLCIYVGSSTGLDPPFPFPFVGSDPSFPYKVGTRGGSAVGFVTDSPGVAKGHGSWALEVG